jgi:hypothetical protein
LFGRTLQAATGYGKVEPIEGRGRVLAAHRQFGLSAITCYDKEVTKLLDQALELARNLSPDAQDDIARIVLGLVGADHDAASFTLTEAERAAVAASKEAASRGEFATDEQVRAAWAKHGL